MPERKFKLTEKQVGELWCAYDECSDGDTKIRYQAVRLYGTAAPLQTILQATGCSISSLREWVRAYRLAGLAGLVDHRTGGNSAKLTPDQRQEVDARLHQFTPQHLLGTATHSASGQFWTVEDLEAALRRWYGVQYQSRSSYYNVLHACGFSYQRAEKVFKSQRPAEIAAFQEMVEKKLIDTAQDAPQTIILTEDEASMYLQATTQAVWAVQGQTPTVRVDPSRTKTNFYGTLNLQTGEELVLQAGKLNSATTAFYLNCVLETYPNVPILYFWDRAPWHRGAAVDRVLQANLRLEIIWYPVASPELNPQEQVWKAARRKVSHNHAQAQLKPLADQFENYLSRTRFASSFLDSYGYNGIRAMFI